MRDPSAGAHFHVVARAAAVERGVGQGVGHGECGRQEGVAAISRLRVEGPVQLRYVSLVPGRGDHAVALVNGDGGLPRVALIGGVELRRGGPVETAVAGPGKLDVQTEALTRLGIGPHGIDPAVMRSAGSIDGDRWRRVDLERTGTTTGVAPVRDRGAEPDLGIRDWRRRRPKRSEAGATVG